MRITILKVGSRGDVQPFIALAVGLRAAGISFARVEGAPCRFMDTVAGQARMASGARPLELLHRMLPFMRRQLREQLDESVRACAGAEAPVFTPLALAGYHLAEKLGIPCFGASHIHVDRGYAEVGRRGVNALRVKSLGLPPHAAPVLVLTHTGRGAAAVHHGGAIMTAACLRAGIPSLVVPIVADQFFWGERIRALGAGPVPFHLTLLTAERLAPAIRQCVSSAGMPGRAAEISRVIRAEDGVARAVEELTAILERSAAAVADRYSTT